MSVVSYDPKSGHRRGKPGAALSVPELVAPAARARPVISEPCPSYGLTVRAEMGGFLPEQPGARGRAKSPTTHAGGWSAVSFPPNTLERFEPPSGRERGLALTKRYAAVRSVATWIGVALSF